MQEDYPEYTDESLTLDALDEYQLLFVSVVLEYVERVLEAIDKDLQEPEPLRLMLLGTAGTGKSTATKTLLQELRRRLQGHKLEVDFFKVAAPTGTAAFNVRFNATTVHRLIHWFTPKYWNEELSDVKLDKLQQALGKTELVVIDEISMVGRQMMGRVDSRLSKAKPHREDSTLGGTGLVCVGDPGQCQAMFDQQLYDTNPHSKSKDFTSNAKLSNRGLQIYEECDKYIILNNVHRINVIKNPKSQEDIDYNVRAQEFLRLLHRLRDLEISIEDYYKLCKRKKSNLSFAERKKFEDAPVLMDFRRETATNPENNCTYHNRMQVRSLSKMNKRPVISIEAQHEGICQEKGLKLDEETFNQLQPCIEVADEARVLLIHNLHVAYGLMNGTQGTVKRVVFKPGGHPNHENIDLRFPHCLIIDFPEYEGPAFFDDADKKNMGADIPD